MSNTSLQDLIARHEAFLECRPVERPLVGLWIGGYYPAEQFPRGTAQWRLEQRLDPQDVRFSPFADDYESLYQAHRAANDWQLIRRELSPVGLSLQPIVHTVRRTP